MKNTEKQIVSLEVCYNLAAMKKLVLFGDSLLANFDKELLIKLESKLSDFDVYNCAVGGWDTNDGVKKSAYISSLKPDLIVIGFGTNDAAPWKQVPLEQFGKNINIILDNFSDSRVIYFLPPPVNENKESKGEKRSNETMRRYHDLAKKICLDKKVGVVDSWTIFIPMVEQNHEYHIEDGLHLNDFGYDTLIDSLAKVINK